MTPEEPLPLCRLTITLPSGTLWHRKPLYSEIVRRARADGLAGASVFLGTEGFGSDGVIHTARILSMSDRLPVMIVIIDEEERIHGFLHGLEATMEIESAVIEQVRAVRLRRMGGVPR